MNAQACIYKGPNNKQCNRPLLSASNYRSKQYCSLHYGCDLKATGELKENPCFMKDFQFLLDTNDGDWCGFVFPADVDFPKEVSFQVDARDSILDSLVLDKVVFKESVDFSGAIFRNRLTVKSTIFESNATFDNCRFEGSVEFISTQFKQATSFYRADFAGRTILRANFNTLVNFNEAIFRDGVVFSGWRSVNLKVSDTLHFQFSGMTANLTTGNSKPTLKQRIQKRLTKSWNLTRNYAKQLQSKSKQIAERIHHRFLRFRRKFTKIAPDDEIFTMFEGEGQFQGVIFLKPDQILFSEVDLARVHFRGTNLRGVRFLGVKWWQPCFNRNGLYDEVYIKKSPDGPFRHLSLPALEETCRNARVALEENRDFNTASDFYMAEMDAVREQQGFWRRHFFSVTALYRCVSRYGTSVGAALWVLCLIYFLHVTASMSIQFPPGIVPSLKELLEIGLRSLKTLLLVRLEPTDRPIPTGQAWLDISLRLLGPVQIAMIAIAFRAKIKRH